VRASAALEALSAAMSGAGEGRPLHRLRAQVVEAFDAPLPGLPVQHVQVPLVDIAGQEMFTDCDWQISGVRSAARSMIHR